MTLSLIASAQHATFASADAATLPDAPSVQASTSAVSPAQQPAAGSPAQTQEDRRAKAQKELSAEEKQRMLGVIPNFSAVMNGHAEPLTSRQKFSLYVKDAFDPFDFMTAGADAALEQHDNEYPEYGRGVSGYAKRYGASFADEFDGGLWASAILPSVLHQDPRYFRLGHGTFKGRLWYSVLSSVRCKGDNGRWQPNYSNLAGNMIGGAISNAYYPAADRGFGLTLQRGGTTAAEIALSSLAIEFYPDVIARLPHRHKAAATPPQP
jgi:hypothetical protein